MKRAALPAGVKESTGPTGLTVWMGLPDCTPEFGIMWTGRSGGLFIGRPLTPGGAVVRIEHRTADGTFDTRAQARAAVAAFLAAGLA